MRSHIISVFNGVLFIFLTGCNQGNGTASFVSNPDEFEDVPLTIDEFLDEYAGHPEDPDLPLDYIGSTDDELIEFYEEDITRILTEGAQFALNNLETPRYLFEVARVAYLFDHSRATEWLKTASNKGSAGARAYLAYQLFDDGEIATSITEMKHAYNDGFDFVGYEDFIALAEESMFLPTKFNQPKLIEALYNNNQTELKRYWPLTEFYVGAIQNALWSSEVLFMVDDPKILLELSPEITAREGLAASGRITTSVKEAIQVVANLFNLEADAVSIIEQGTQDGRRMAFLYESNPGAFKKIYNGMLTYSRNNRSENE